MKKKSELPADNDHFNNKVNGSIFSILIDGVAEKTIQISNNYFSGDHAKFVFKNIISPEFAKELNLSELEISSDITINQLLLKIAENTVVSDINKNDNGFTPKLKKISFKEVKHLGVSESVFLSSINKYKGISEEEKINNLCFLQKYNKNDTVHLNDGIFNHDKSEFKEEFLWHVMEHYGNYHLSRLIFDHFLDEHKEKFKIYDKISYTTEIHRFLFEIVKNEEITLKEALTKILGEVNDVHELSALHILVHELKDNNFDSSCIVAVIDNSLSILRILREQCPRNKYIRIINKLNFLPKTQYIGGDNFRVILEHIQLDGKEITAENIMIYGDKSRLHFYKGSSVVPIYEKIFVKNTIANQEEPVESKGSKLTDFSTGIIASLTALFSKKVLKFGPILSANINQIIFDIRSHSFFDDKNTKNTEDIKFDNPKDKQSDFNLGIHFEREASIILLHFIQQFQSEIEMNVQSYKDVLNGIPAGKIKKIMMKMASQKGLEEAIKLLTYTSKGSKLYYLLFVKLYTKALIIGGIIFTKILVRSDKFKQWRSVTGVKKGIRFKISYVLKNYLNENADILFKIAQLESEKFYLETIVNKSEDFSIDTSENIDMLERLGDVIQELNKINPEQYYVYIEELVQDSIRLQAKAFSQTIDEMKSTE